ncbi:glycosyltransferase [Alteromonas sp. BMJM2]|uniref:glycosyltransferase n=1 Tax=Alteromonas sp. BMJM2 TaxID=2954241 RepID=UPI0022B5D33E|nr:glycosyltransferase [Alteromonas sp. BMJM2]
MNKKIIFLINSIKYGGAERALASILSKPELYDGLDVSIVLLDDEPLEREMPKNINLIKLNSKGSMLNSVVNLHSYLRQVSPDLVVSFLVRSNVSNAFLRLFNQVPKSILCERMHLSSHLDNQFSGIKRKLSSLLPRLLYRYADAVVGVSTGVTNDLVLNFSLPLAKAFTIYNPYNTQEIAEKAELSLEINTPDEYIVSTGRLTPAKNFKHLIDSYLSSKEPSPLCILGEGEQKEELLDYISQRNAADKVLLLGYAKNPFPILAKAKYYISASTNEGFPNALVEAMAVGLPVIMTNCPSGPAEILEEDETFDSKKLHLAKHGILVPLGDEHQLTEAINQYQNSQLRCHYSEKSIERVGDFHIDKIATDYWQFLKSVLNN